MQNKINSLFLETGWLFYSKLSNTFQLVLNCNGIKEKKEMSSGIPSSDGSGSKIFDPGWVSHLWYVFGFENFPLKIPTVCSLGQKNLIGSGQKVPGSRPSQPLIYCGSKVCSDRVLSRPISNPKGDIWGTNWGLLDFWTTVLQFYCSTCWENTSQPL